MSKGKYTKTTKISGYKPLALLLALALLMGCAIGGTIAWLTDTTQEVKNTFTTSNIDITLTETDATPGTDGNQTRNYTMVPGWTMAKDPVVTVSAESEDCYLFVKVEKTGSATLGTGDAAQTLGIDNYLAYNLATEDATAGWTQLKDADNKDVPNVYYRIVNKADTTKAFHLLLAGSIDNGKYEWADDEVLTKPTVTKEMMDALNVDGAEKPSITFTAYASQLWKTNKPTKTADMTDEAYNTAVTNAKFTPAQAWDNVNPTT